MKRSLITFMIILAVISGMPRAFRQVQDLRDAGATWLRSKMFEGLINSTQGTTTPDERRPCGTESTGPRETADSNNVELPTRQLISRINIGAKLYDIQ